jgi:UDP-glucose 4-epimerase
MKETMLITGGLGFVGGRLTKKLSPNNIIIVSSRKQPSEELLTLHGNPTFVLHSELLNENKFPQQVDTIIHLAALNEWDSVKFPAEAIAINIDQTRAILELAIASKVKRFIYFSTAHIYGSPLQGHIDEQTLPVPTHPYAITHRAAEDYIIAANHHKKIQCYIIRLSNAFGAPVTATVNRWTLLTNDLCRQAIEKGAINLTSNGCQYRDFICLSDVEQAIEQITNEQPQKIPPGIYNLGSGKAMQVIDMAKIVAEEYKKLFKKELPIHLPSESLPSQEPVLNFDISKLTQAGIKIDHPVNKEVRQLLQFCQHNFTANA